MPPDLLRKLDIKVGSHLVIEEKSYGIILCKLELYDTFLGQFEADMIRFDDEIRNATKIVKNMLGNVLKKKNKEELYKPINELHKQ